MSSGPVSEDESILLALTDVEAAKDGISLAASTDGGVTFVSDDCVPNVKDKTLECEVLGTLDVTVVTGEDFLFLDVDLADILDGNDDIDVVGTPTPTVHWQPTGWGYWASHKCVLSDDDQQQCEDHLAIQGVDGACNSIVAVAVPVGNDCTLQCACIGAGNSRTTFMTNESVPMPSVTDDPAI